MKLEIRNQHITVSQREPLVSGTVNVYTAEFSFDSAWDGYAPVAVFESAGVRDKLRREMAITDGKCTVPWETLLPNSYLRIGVYGVSGDKRLPTIYADSLFVSRGTEPADPAAEPTPGVVEQFAAQVAADRAAAEAAAQEICQRSPLKGKIIVNFGDSVFGMARPPEDISTRLAELTGATVHNCAFSGTGMSAHWNRYWTEFSMFSLADAIAASDFSAQEEAAASEDMPDCPSCFAETVALLKSIDFSQVDIATIAYGANDWANDVRMDDETDTINTSTFAGALRYSIETLLTAYPNLRLFICTPTWRFWQDSGGVYTDDSDTRTNSSGATLPEFAAKAKEIAADYHLPCIDHYDGLGINKFNRLQYFAKTDGAHHILSGRQLIAGHMAKYLF